MQKLKCTANLHLGALESCYAMLFQINQIIKTKCTTLFIKDTLCNLGDENEEQHYPAFQHDNKIISLYGLIPASGNAGSASENRVTEHSPSCLRAVGLGWKAIQY
jgi:hypothetical protein